MATFADLQGGVSRRLLDANNQAVSLADVSDAINDAISYWKFRRFWFNEVYNTLALTAQDGLIPLAGNFLVPSTEVDGFNIAYGNTRYPLVKLTQQEYDAYFLDNGYGLPSWYARVGQEYRVYPLPDKDYTIKAHYLKDYEPLVNADDTNDFTICANRLILLWSTANLTAEFRQDDKMESYFRKAAADEYRNLRVMSDKSNGTGRLTLYSNL